MTSAANYSHAFSYSTSSRAKCYGPSPCTGSSIAVGTLRYGKIVPDGPGDSIEWRHWGCVSPDILTNLAAENLDNVAGFRDLKFQDQQRIRLAVSRRQVDPRDVPASANATHSSISKPRASQKRKVADDVAVTNALSSSLSHVSSSEEREEEDSEDNHDDIRDELYCVLPTSVVGIQYYHGLVGAGEEVVLLREPTNPYDRNAIQVKNIGSTQVGHIPRNVAAKLAPLLDQRLVTVEGIMRQGNLSGGKAFSLKIELKIYGRSDMRAALEPKLVWATPGQHGFDSQGASRAAATSRARGQQEEIRKAAELRQTLSSLERVDDEGRRSSLLDSLCSTEDILSLPLHPNPPGIESGHLKVDLLKHQSQALQWCIDREYPVLPKSETDKPVQFWQFRKNGNKIYYYNIATKTPRDTQPVLGRGALCADAMGLGKTLTMLALILATKDDIPRDSSNSTLIVVPLSILSNWQQQIEEHCMPGFLSLYIYYGTNRSLSTKELGKYDVVLTTYQTVAGEHGNSSTSGPGRKKKKMERSLFDMNWKRIILDEGHTIRNPSTKMAKAVFALTGQRRWVLTGTPIINSPRDLGSILTFLRICRPLDNPDFFKRLLLRPLKDADPSGAELLRALMSQICIRRTKEMQDKNGQPLIPLPPVEMIVIPVKLTEEARVLYDEVEQLSKQRVENFLSASTNRALVHSNILSMLTRMRQLVLHTGLIPTTYIQSLRLSETNSESPRQPILSAEEVEGLQRTLAQAVEELEECPICLNILNEPRITSCAHIYCLTCITEVLSRDPRCPMDRQPLALSDLHEPPPPTELTQVPAARKAVADNTRDGSSAKIDQLVRLLQLIPLNEKSLVFSQFTSFLDKIADVFDKKGIPYLRFDGQMSAQRRQETIARFSVPPDDEPQPTAYEDDLDYLEDMDTDKEDIARSRQRGNRSKGKARSRENPRVLLLSLKAGAMGLNLTVANNVFLMDPWWQEGIESQAIDRVNRIGQKRPVHVYQLIAENTVESKVLEIQNRKKQLIQQAFSGMKHAETQRQRREARLQDLIELFGVRQQGSQAS